MWVLDHLDDLESDFSRFHRVDDIYALDGSRFFRLAARIFAYGGVMTARVQEEANAPTGPQRSVQGQQRGTRSVSLSEMQAAHPGWIERTVSRG